MRAGSIWINCYFAFDADAPFGGYKLSGFGRDLGLNALDKYLQVKSVVTPLYNSPWLWTPQCPYNILISFEHFVVCRMFASYCAYWSLYNLCNYYIWMNITFLNLQSLYLRLITNKTLRFEALWLEDYRFADMVQSWWESFEVEVSIGNRLNELLLDLDIYQEDHHKFRVHPLLSLRALVLASMGGN